MIAAEVWWWPGGSLPSYHLPSGSPGAPGASCWGSAGHAGHALPRAGPLSGSMVRLSPQVKGLEGKFFLRYAIEGGVPPPDAEVEVRCVASLALFLCPASADQLVTSVTAV